MVEFGTALIAHMFSEHQEIFKDNPFLFIFL